MRTQIIHLHQEAPAKPPVGAPCNGCGVCCAAETCPAGRIRFLRQRGPCPALEWHGTRYQCGLLLHPDRYFRFLNIVPAFMTRWTERAFRRWIAAGAGCDSSAEPEPQSPD